MNYPDVKEFFSAIKNYHKDIGDNFEPPPIILPKLRSYQRKAVKWMLDREKNNDSKLIFSYVLHHKLTSNPKPD